MSTWWKTKAQREELTLVDECMGVLLMEELGVIEKHVVAMAAALGFNIPTHQSAGWPLYEECWTPQSVARYKEAALDGRRPPVEYKCTERCPCRHGTTQDAFDLTSRVPRHYAPSRGTD